jgi:spore coat protein U-like protein
MKRLIVAAVALSVVSFAGTAMALDTNNLAVSAVVTGTCRFNSTGAMGFGNLDPALATDATATATTQFWCTKGASYTLSNDNGLNFSGGLRMKHSVLAEYMPYSISYTAAGTGAGKTTPVSVNISGTIANANYVDASEGNYADTVVLTINP